MELLKFFRARIGGQALFDFFSWLIAVFGAAILRFDFDYSRAATPSFLVLSLGAATTGFAVGKLSHLYRGRFSTGSLDELFSLAFSALVTGSIFGLVTVFAGNMWGIPRSTIFIATPFFVFFAASSRITRRLVASRNMRQIQASNALVYGAGQLAERLVPFLLSDPRSPFRPVGLLDDDPRKSNRWISGIKMFGQIQDLENAAKKTGAQKLIVAIPQVTSEILTRTRELAEPLGLDVYVMPTFSEILDNPSGSFRLKELDIEELVGRRAIRIESLEVRELLHEKCVLITGAGGSIGLELCRQVTKHAPKKLVFLDRDETGLHQAKLESKVIDEDAEPVLALADIRDLGAIEAVFNANKPHVVFHAAALKHLPILEEHPQEGWKTNVIGTSNVLEAALKIGVETFVNISTDKAADPKNILGRSKLLAEKMTAWASKRGPGQYASVRFGNVLGSRGSLVPTIRHSLENNMPVFLTHPDATRYFMSVSEACQLVLQAGTQAGEAEVFMLDMGEPVKIVEIAERMIELSKKTAEVKFTGLRPGEKLHEVLYEAGDSPEPTSHKSIFKVASQALDPKEIDTKLDWFLSGK